METTSINIKVLKESVKKRENTLAFTTKWMGSGRELSFASPQTVNNIEKEIEK